MVELAGPRVLLREVRAADVALIHAGASDPAVVRYMSWGPNDEAATGAFVERCLASQEIAPRGSMDLVFEAVGEARKCDAVTRLVWAKAADEGRVGACPAPRAPPKQGCWCRCRRLRAEAALHAVGGPALTTAM